ncbi:hypothetical protein SESBI_43238 [Sesbania bispinosa]|nr:hypothetical protein SESBI_43238 [Sesbania bispinosa]
MKAAVVCRERERRSSTTSRLLADGASQCAVKVDHRREETCSEKGEGRGDVTGLERGKKVRV